MQKIALIGIGEIGRRHLQAISKLNIDYELICFDKSIDAIGYLPEFCNSNNINRSNINIIKKENNFYNSINNETLVIIATTAKDRKEVLDICIEKKPLTIIAEKPLVQNYSDYQYIINKAKDYEVNIYINFLARAQSFWKNIHKVFEKKNISLCTCLPRNWGIACVGIHHFDLFTWFTGEKNYEIIGSTVKDIFEQKRMGFYDVAGSLLLRTEKGNQLYINSSDNADISSVQFINDTKIYNYYELQQKMVTIDENNDVKIISAKELYVSNYMTDVIENLLNNTKYVLPDIYESQTAHRMLFEYLRINDLKDLNIT